MMIQPDESWERLASSIESQIHTVWKQIDQIAETNQEKILQAFQNKKVSEFHFLDSTGYGYDDAGRETLDRIYADVFGAESAIVRPHLVSGTHTIATALFGLLRPGDRLMSLTGKPYDTLQKVIGKDPAEDGTILNWGIGYDEVPLLDNGQVNWDLAFQMINKKTKVIAIQRSRGYDVRPSFTVEEIGDMVRNIKSQHPDLIVFVDNCYGEFAEAIEPPEVGVDIIAGSLIKNPGGGIVTTGGYLAGRADLIQRAANRLTAPGLGSELGAMLGQTRLIFQGLFLAPHFVSQALKGAVFAAALLEHIGFETSPRWSERRTDLIQTVQFHSAEQVIRFVQSIQQASPVDSFVLPEPSEMPGYDHPVIMAAGTFIQGGSLELTADAPIREPYLAFLQGGLTYEQIKGAMKKAMFQLKQDGVKI